MDNYMPRVADAMLQRKLHTSGAVLIIGCKWCGKTMTGRNVAKSAIDMQDPAQSPELVTLAMTQPDYILRGKAPRLIDEWQMAPILWDAVRYEVDRRAAMGQFILTGSAVPNELGKSHTGTGRIARLKMRPMSLFESGESTAQISIKALFDNASDIAATSTLNVEGIAHAICRGGWPAALNIEREYSYDMARNYVDAIVEEDIVRVDGVERNPQRVRALLRSYARNISTLSSNSTIMADMSANDQAMTAPTFSAYINALQRIFVIEDIEAWLPSLRSKTAIRTSAKRQFADPSIAAAVMRQTPEGLLKDLNTFGFLFESLCARDLRIYAEALDGTLYHYRDKNELEADLVIALHDGRWGAIEVKLGGAEIDKGADNLIKLANKTDSEKMGAPSFLMVVTGGKIAYRRPDGVVVAPIATLRP